MSKEDRLKYAVLNAAVRGKEFEYADPDDYFC